MGSALPRTVPLKTGLAITIRNPSEADAAALIAHRRSVIAESEFSITQLDELEDSEEQERDWIRARLQDPGKLALVAEVNRNIVGLIQFETGSRKRLAHRGTFSVGVQREWRGVGIGTALIESLLQWARDTPGIEKVGLGVLSENASAIRLYRRCGFLEEGRLIREVKLGPEKYADDVQMYQWVK